MGIMERSEVINIFDFDGTLTKPHSGYNTWETLWVELGYPVEYCEKYHKLYSNNEISHDEWCEITEKFFKEKGLTRKELISASKNAELLADVKEVITYLKSKGIMLYILSGSIKQYIEIVLNDEFVYTSGVETLCINPSNTDYYNSKVWHNYLRNVKSLKEVLPFIEK